MKCSQSGLILPKQFVDEKQSLKKLIDDYVDNTVMQHQYLKKPYFFTFHAKFNPHNPGEFQVDPPKITMKLPPFMSNTMVYWVCNTRGVCELLWTVPPKKQGEKLKVNFNKEGVAFLQAKGAMPSNVA